MDRHQTFFLLFGFAEASVFHPEWVKDVAPHIHTERLPTHFFDHTAKPVGVNAVVPRRAGVCH
jgi:hypothetical protein